MGQVENPQIEELTASKAKELLLPIPKEEFILYYYERGGKHCSLGHLNKLIGGDAYLLAPTSAFIGSVYDFIKRKYGEVAGLTTVNDTIHVNNYTEDNPKDRVIHLLNDMIAEGL